MKYKRASDGVSLDASLVRKNFYTFDTLVNKASFEGVEANTIVAESPTGDVIKTSHAGDFFIYKPSLSARLNGDDYRITFTVEGDVVSVIAHESRDTVYKNRKGA